MGRYLVGLSYIWLYVDNTATLGMINKRTTPCAEALKLLRELSDLAVLNDFTIEAIYISSSDNILADAISRFHVASYMSVFVDNVLQHVVNVPLLYWLPNHMSHDAMRFLSSQIAQRWENWHVNWMQKLRDGAVQCGHRPYD
jgi:hypothetical protein